MRAVVQRTGPANVTVGARTVGSIAKGYMVLLGVETEDTPEDAIYIADKIANLRVFEDGQDKLNLSILDVGGQVLLVSQFTLYGDVRKGRRPSFIKAAGGPKAIELFDAAKKALEAFGLHVETGEFGAHMQVNLQNDGPVTILLDSKKTL